MKSSRTPALIDLDQDLPTTREDIKVLRRLRIESGLTSFEELQRAVNSLPPAVRRPPRTTAAGWPAFEL